MLTLEFARDGCHTSSPYFKITDYNWARRFSPPSRLSGSTSQAAACADLPA